MKKKLRKYAAAALCFALAAVWLTPLPAAADIVWMESAGAGDRETGGNETVVFGIGSDGENSENGSVGGDAGGSTEGGSGGENMDEDFGDQETSSPAPPQIRIESAEKAYTVGQEMTEDDGLIAEVSGSSAESDEGVLTYRWFQCSDLEGGDPEPVGEENCPKYFPSVESEGVFYYYLQAVYTVGEESSYEVKSSEARSEIITVTVGYMVEFEGGSDYEGTIPPAIGPVISGAEVTLPEALKRPGSGFIFDGWQRKDAFDSDIFQPGQVYIFDKKDVEDSGESQNVGGEEASDTDELQVADEEVLGTDESYRQNSVIFCALWRAAEVYDYMIEGGEEAERLDSDEGAYIGRVFEEDVLDAPQAFRLFARKGYLFDGWNIVLPDGTPEKDSDGQALILKPGDKYEPFGNFSLSAVWKRLYTVSYDSGVPAEPAGSGVTGTLPENGSYISGNSVILPAAGDLKYEGHFLKGWRADYIIIDELTGQGEQFSEYVEIGEAFLMPEADVVFTAQWEPVSVWGGSAAERFAAGTGTESDPYLISGADELAKLAQDVAGVNGAKQNSYADTYFRMTADMDLAGIEWLPIGCYGMDSSDETSFERGYPFCGYFDGNGHTVSGLTIGEDGTAGNSRYLSAGLFGYIESSDAEKVSVKDLSVEGARISLKPEGKTRRSADCGIIVGRLTGSISGCSASGEISVKLQAGSLSYCDSASVGGVAGCVKDGFLSECESSVRIGVSFNVSTASCSGLSVGGIVGYGDGVKIVGCTNSGRAELSVSASTTEWLDAKQCTVGGITGQAFQGEITDCVNVGNVEGNGNDTILAGGIAGYAETDIKGCRNSGDVEILTTRQAAHGKYVTGAAFSDSQSVVPMYAGPSAGGIAGYARCDITGCENTGDVKISHQCVGLYAAVRAGGIAGGATDGQISDCFNAGDISAGAGDLTYLYKNYLPGIYAGGIVGLAGNNDKDASQMCDTYVSRGEKISYVYNIGDVSLTAQESEKLDTAAGLLVGRCAYETDIYSAYVVSEKDSSEGGETVSSSAAKRQNAAGTAEADRVSSVGDRTGMTASSAVEEKAEELFYTGEVAYLLDGGTQARNIWTQTDGLYPTLGEPRVNRVASASDDSCRITLGRTGLSEKKEQVYARRGEDVFVAASADEEDRIVLKEWTERSESQGGTTYYRYNTYQGNIPDRIIVQYIEGPRVEVQGDSFTMSYNCDASVSVSFKYGEATEIVDSWFVPKTDNGAGGSGGSGGGEGDGDQPGEDDGSEGNGSDVDSDQSDKNNGSDREEDDVKHMPENDTDISERNDPATARMSLPAEMQMKEKDESESDDAAPDSGGKTEGMQDDSESGEAPDTMKEDQDSIFEVIEKTVRKNPLPAMALTFLFLLVAMCGGYFGYRKRKKKNRKIGKF